MFTASQVSESSVLQLFLNYLLITLQEQRKAQLLCCAKEHDRIFISVINTSVCRQEPRKYVYTTILGSQQRAAYGQLRFPISRLQLNSGRCRESLLVL